MSRKKNNDARTKCKLKYNYLITIFMLIVLTAAIIITGRKWQTDRVLPASVYRLHEAKVIRGLDCLKNMKRKKYWCLFNTATHSIPNNPHHFMTPRWSWYLSWNKITLQYMSYACTDSGNYWVSVSNQYRETFHIIYLYIISNLRSKS